MRWQNSGLFLALALCWCGSSVPAIDRANLRFYLPFEGNIQPLIAGPNTRISFAKGTEQDAQLVEGRRGQGLKVTPHFRIQYLTRESFTPREGTMTCWMKPMGWTDNKIRFFLVTHADRFALHFYTYFGTPWFYIAGPERYDLVGGGNWPQSFDKTPFAEGEWVFFAGTYKPGQQAFYINGKLIVRRMDGLVEPEFIEKGIVEIPAGEQVIDEVMIFDRALTEQEIRAVYQANVPDSGQVKQ